MSTKTVLAQIQNLNTKIKGINSWIEANPTIVDPNVYEIMDCNVEYAELISSLRIAHEKEYGELEEPVKVLEGVLDEENPEPNTEKYNATVPPIPPIGLILTTLYPPAAQGLFELGKMEKLRSLDTHPFFETSEVKNMYENIKKCQIEASYVVPEDETIRKIKKELICKSMSVPFYIWQVKRTEPDYQYDNKSEFEMMQAMNALYQDYGTQAQFGKEINNLHTVIDSAYKYGESTAKTVGQK